MAQTTVSSAFRIVIPRETRECIALKIGQVLQVINKGGMIILVPDQALSALKGFLGRMKTKRIREKRDRY
jgi:AbrB family looped-hinge helix DNA binding protein